MGKLEQLEHQIQNLSPDELAAFRAWFLEFDWRAWDEQLERDVAAGKLDKLGDQALADHSAEKARVFESLCDARFLGVLQGATGTCS
jgi:hypothetical protein